jgi:hypothetical protein
MATGMPSRCMTDYLAEEEQYLSPVVVVTTIILVVTFAIGILYQLAGPLI